MLIERLVTWHVSEAMQSVCCMCQPELVGYCLCHSASAVAIYVCMTLRQQSFGDTKTAYL